jgi:hypothetical protein
MADNWGSRGSRQCYGWWCNVCWNTRPTQQHIRLQVLLGRRCYITPGWTDFLGLTAVCGVAIRKSLTATRVLVLGRVASVVDASADEYSSTLCRPHRTDVNQDNRGPCLRFTDSLSLLSRFALSFASLDWTDSRFYSGPQGKLALFSLHSFAFPHSNFVWPLHYTNFMGHKQVMAELCILLEAESSS